MKSIRIECPSCQQPIEFEPPPALPAKADHVMRLLMLLIAAGIGFIAWMQWHASGIGQWNYDVQTVENDAHAEYYRYATNAANRNLAPVTLEEPGDFSIETTVFSNGLYGWEFLAAVPELETTYPPNRPPYVRTGKVDLLFRRRK